MSDSVKILKIEPVTHNVRRYVVERPEGYSFEPGQATELSLDEDGWRDKKHPFTFTEPSADGPLEFTIKSYFNTDGDGMTERLWSYEPGQSLILRDPWGTITYKGPGTFIAGGAGVTPFIAILRKLHRDGQLAGHRLIASHGTEEDIILREEFEAMDGLDCTWTLTNDPKADGVQHARVDEGFLRKHLHDVSQHFYLCGPDDMVKDLRDALEGLGAETDTLTFEE
ncbi:FAD-binding oxidoreductase [Devosia sp.]|uniref:FAD-binding oxidoreductase n=1 Tax=Devosia sp. TaxID=1871048 RepID=UPI003A94E450